MKIGELSQRTGVSVRMLRYYENEQLIRPNRTAAGYRIYTSADQQTVFRIQVLSQAGLTLSVIKRLLPCIRNDQLEFRPCDMLKSTLQARVTALEHEIDGLTRSRNLLLGFLAGVIGSDVEIRQNAAHGAEQRGSTVGRQG
jgi:DNA-binding transcriptional MerR regulator